MKKDNYITILGWMVSDLKLNGNELVLYALIYGFSQDGETEFYGSLDYIKSALNMTRQGALNIIERLEKKGLIGVDRTKGKSNRYCTTSQKTLPVKKVDNTSQKTLLDQSKKLTGTSQKNRPYNTSNNNTYNNKYKNSESDFISSGQISFPFGEKVLKKWGDYKRYLSDQFGITYKSYLAEESKLKSLRRLARKDEDAISIIDQTIAATAKKFWALPKEGPELSELTAEQQEILKNCKGFLKHKINWIETDKDSARLVDKVKNNGLTGVTLFHLLNEAKSFSRDELQLSNLLGIHWAKFKTVSNVNSVTGSKIVKWK